MSCKNRHPLIDKNLAFIKAHLKTHTLNWIAKQIGFEGTNFYRYAKRYGFKGRDMRSALSIDWQPEQLRMLKKYFPTSFNKELAKEIGVSWRTLVRKARELGLEKETDFLDKNRKTITRMATACRPKNDAATIARITESGKPYRFSSTHRPATKVDGKKIWETRRANAAAQQQALKQPY